MNNLNNDQYSKLENCYTDNESSVCQELLESFSLNPDGEYFYLKGNLLAKEGNFSQARILFEKAKFSGYENSLLENNLSFVKKQLRTKYIEESNDISSQLYSFTNNYTYTFWSLFLWPLFIWFVLLFINKSKWLIKIIPLLMMLIFSSLVIYTKESGIVSFSNKDVAIFDGPSRAFDQVREVPAGIKLITKELRKNWYYIVFPDNLSGWVPKEDLEFLD
ncbi:SH3 domain-containing protein [Bacteriovoracaceae bacterium]|nr:SH3 domain-containing protein [Bacteriovoracaceae bacterium]